jgi:hypothetical protein
MNRGTWPGTAVIDAVTSGPVSEIKGAMSTEPNPYLLGEGATQFKIAMKNGLIGSDSFTNPLSVEVELNFQKDATGRKVDKHVKDEAVIRNKITNDIYIDGIPYSLKKD